MKRSPLYVENEELSSSAESDNQDTKRDGDGKIVKKKKFMSPQEKAGISQVSQKSISKFEKTPLKGNLFGTKLDREELNDYLEKSTSQKNSFSTIHSPDLFSRTAASKLETDEELNFIESSSEDAFDPLLFMADVSKLKDQYCVSSTNYLLPPIESNLKTLVLDLDETLVHATVEHDKENPPDIEFDVDVEGKKYHVYVNFRPGVYQFLDTLVEHFEIVIFTASLPSYATKVLDIFETKKPYFAHRLFRSACTEVQQAAEKYYLKDLERLGRNLNQTIIIDNSIHVFSFQIDNGIPIESWFNDANDAELDELIPFLMQLKEADDVRPLIAEKFKLSEEVELLQKRT